MFCPLFICAFFVIHRPKLTKKQLKLSFILGLIELAFTFKYQFPFRCECGPNFDICVRILAAGQILSIRGLSSAVLECDKRDD